MILPADTVVSTDAGGVVRLRSPFELGPYPASITARLDFWADQAPGQTFLAARNRDGEWTRLDYATVRARVRAVAQALLERGLEVKP